MEIREFVRDVLVDLVEGIKEAQAKEGVGGYIAPDAIGGHQFPTGSGVSHMSRVTSTVVKFDMAVTAEASRGSGVGGKAKIVVVEADSAGTIEARNAQASRIQFSVPVCAENSDSDISVMKSADQRMRHNASDPLNGARDRCVLVQ